MRAFSQGMNFFRHRPWFTAISGAVLSWFIAGWWWGPIRSYALALGESEACTVLGLDEDGSLIGVERLPNTAVWSVWKRQFPDCGRQDVWSTTGLRKQPPEDVLFRLQDGGRWLLVSKYGSEMPSNDDPIVDLRTGTVYAGVDDGMRWVLPDGRLVLTDDSTSGIRINDLHTGTVVGRIDDDWINAISDDGRWIAAETAGILRVWRLDDNAVSLTKITLAAALPTSARLGSTNDADHQRACQFTDDSQRLVVFGDRRLEIWDLATESPTVLRKDASPIAVSNNGERAYERNGHVLETKSGDTLVDPAGWRNDIIGVRIRPDGWFLSQRNPQSSWWGRGWPGAQLRIGPYTIAIQADQSLQTIGCDLMNADTGRRVMLPRWFLPASITPGGYRDEWALYTHPQRFALHNEESGLVRVIDMPPHDTTLSQLLTALALFVIPGAWCWRNGTKASQRFA